MTQLVEASHPNQRAPLGNTGVSDTRSSLTSRSFPQLNVFLEKSSLLVSFSPVHLPFAPQNGLLGTLLTSSPAATTLPSPGQTSEVLFGSRRAAGEHTDLPADPSWPKRPTSEPGGSHQPPSGPSVSSPRLQGSIPGPQPSLPASNFPPTRPAPSQARPGRRPLPLPAAPHVLGARVPGGPTRGPSTRRSRTSPRGLASPRPYKPEPGPRDSRMRPAVTGLALAAHTPPARPASPPARRRSLLPAPPPGPASARPLGRRTGNRAVPSARPPGGLASSPPHPDPHPPPPFLPADVRTWRGRESRLAGSRLGSAASPAPGPAISVTESSGSGRLRAPEAKAAGAEVTSRCRRRRRRARAPAAYRLPAAAMTPRERASATVFRRSRRCRRRHRGRHRLRLPRDVSSNHSLNLPTLHPFVSTLHHRLFTAPTVS
ncbi:uncharacterized protein RHO17_008082 [Thomomys bottae]